MPIALKSVLAPVPETRRGYGIQIDACSNAQSMVYCNGKHVVVRNIQEPSQCRIFAEHKCAVSVAKFSPNGEWIASGDGRGRVLVWSVSTHIIKSEINVCRNVLDIAWGPEGKRIVACGDGNDSFARAFMWDSGNTVGNITNHSKQILSCSYRSKRPFRVITCSEDKQVNMYSGPPFRFTRMYDGHTRFPNQVRFSPNGDHFISVASDKNINVFDGKTGEFVTELSANNNDAHQGSIWSFCWSPDSSEICTVSGDQTAKLWNVASGRVLVTFLFPHDNDTNRQQQVGCVWRQDVLITVALCGDIHFLDRDNPEKPSRTLVGHTVSMSAISVNSTSRTIFSSSSNGSIISWNADSNTVLPLVDVGDGQSNVSCVVSECGAGASLYACSFDDKIRKIKLNSNEIDEDECVMMTPGQPVHLCISTIDAIQVLVTTNKVMVLYKQGQKVCDITLTFKPTCVSLSPDACEIAVSGDKSVHLFAISGDTMCHKQQLNQHTDTTYAVAYSPDGRFLASSDGQRYIYLWNRSDYSLLNRSGWRFHNARVCGLAFSPCSTKLSSCSVDQSVIVWNDMQSFDSGKRDKIDPAHMGGVSRVVFLSDHEVVSFGDDRAVKIWTLT